MGLLGVRGLAASRARAGARAASSRTQGLRHSIDLPGMIAEQIRAAVRPLPAIDVRRVCDAPTRDAFCEIGSVCFHVPLTWFREVFENDSVWDSFRRLRRVCRWRTGLDDGHRDGRRRAWASTTWRRCPAISGAATARR